jgi:uncharacterized protein with NRDE domain
MCICCILVNSSHQFPFILCSVRDELLSRPTSDVKVHPDSGTTCCLDESLPQEKRGTWLAVNPKLGTFSLLTNSAQPGRPEPQDKTKVPSRGLLVLSAAETATGRLSEKNLAISESWTTTTTTKRTETTITSSTETATVTTTEEETESETEQEERTRENIFSSPESIENLSGFNLLSGCLVPGKIDVRYSSNLYGKEFDKCLFSSSSSSNVCSWALSNTFIDNVHEPRLEFIREVSRKKLAEYFSSNSNIKDAKEIANLLGEVLLSRPNFSDEDLPIEHLNLSDKDKQNPIEVQCERECQRNISSFCEFDIPEKKDEGTRLQWGTRTHIIVISEKTKGSDSSSNNDNQKNANHIVHFFIRSLELVVDHSGPRHGSARQPNFQVVPGEWKHLILPHQQE